MAHTIAMFYNVDLSVGKGGANSSTDVMLVQYMLFHIMVQPIPNWVGQFLPGFPDNPASGIGPPALFPHNGIYTPQLDDWITTFQGDCNAIGFGPLTVDGRVNPSSTQLGKTVLGKSNLVHHPSDE